MKIAAYIDSESKSLLLPILTSLTESFNDIQILIISKNDNSKKFGSINWLGLKTIFLQKKIGTILKKQKADIFIAENAALIPRLNIPQYLYISNEDIVHRLKKSLPIAKYIFTAENYLHEILAKKRETKSSIIETIYYGLQQNNTTQQDKEAIKNSITNGYDYFLYVADASSQQYLVTVLKAFSIFKKWQKSSLKMVVFLDKILIKNVKVDIENYKYKDEVIFVSNNFEEVSIAAHTVIYLSKYTPNSIGLFLLNNSVSLIVEDNLVNKSIFVNAALFTTLNADYLSEKMQTLYKDEYKRNEILHNSKIVLAKYSNKIAAQKMYKIISNEI